MELKLVERKNRAVFGILLLVFVFFVILMIFASYTIRQFRDDDGSSALGTSKGESIAVVEINGAIMTSKSVIELLHKAEKDKKTKAILIRVNSPGGAVGPTQEIYEEIQRIDLSHKKTKGTEGKPVYSSFGSVAASGGYYIGAATRKIFTNAGTITGSIGVIMEFIDLSELFKLAKVKPQKIKAGLYKDIGNPNRPMTDEEKALMDNMIKGVHQQFIDDIMKTRKGRIKGNIKDLAQGQIFSGEQALKLGLVDGIAGLWQAGRLIHAELGIEQDFGLKFIKKKKKSNFFEVLESLDTKIGQLGQTLGLGEEVMLGKTPRLMFQP